MILLSEAKPGHIYEYQDVTNPGEQILVTVSQKEHDLKNRYDRFDITTVAGDYTPYLNFKGPPGRCVFGDGPELIKEVQVSELPLYFHLPYKSDYFYELLKGYKNDTPT